MPPHQPTLNSLNSVALTCVAILFTSASYFSSLIVIQKGFRLLGSLLIGIVVVLTGYLMASIHGPAWLVIAAPIPRLDSLYSGAWSRVCE